MAKAKPRNPLAFHPLMKKGGAHEKSNKAKTQALKQTTRKLVVDSCAQRITEHEQNPGVAG